MPTPTGWTFVAAYTIASYADRAAAKRAAAESVRTRDTATKLWTVRLSDSGLAINLYSKPTDDVGARNDSQHARHPSADQRGRSDVRDEARSR